MKNYTDVIGRIPSCPNPKVPAPLAPMSHLTDVQLRFSDIDMLGHVNNNAYLQLLDLAKTRFFNDLRGDKIQWSNPGVVIVNINISFYAQAFMGERLGVLTGVVSVSEKRFVLEQRVVNLDTGVANCVAQTVMATFCKETMKSIVIDDNWRCALISCMDK